MTIFIPISDGENRSDAANITLSEISEAPNSVQMCT